MKTTKLKGKVTFPVTMELEIPDFPKSARKEVEFNETQTLIEIECLESKQRPKVDIWVKVDGLESLQILPSSYNPSTNKIIVSNSEGFSGTIIIS